MAGISAALAVTLEDRAKLERLVRSGKTEQRLAFRSRIVLQAAKGWSNSAIAEALGTSRPTVIDWRKRYEAEGIAGLSHDRPRGRSFQSLFTIYSPVVARVSAEPYASAFPVR